MVTVRGQGENPVIDQTRVWVEDVVVGLNLCPFAGSEVERGGIRYAVAPDRDTESALQALMRECDRLDKDGGVETTLVICPEGFRPFHDFLDLLDIAERLLIEQGYEGVYQLASFHPDYCFEGAEQDDPANFTNRAPYPTLHLIREESLARVLASYPNPEAIPKHNIALTRKLGLAQMRALLNACYEETGRSAADD